MSKRAKKAKPVKLEVGQRWVYAVSDHPGDDDIILTVKPLRTRDAEDVGEEYTWTAERFREVHPRLRDPSELGPQTVTLPEPTAADHFEAAAMWDGAAKAAESVGKASTAFGCIGDPDARTAALVSELHDLTNELATVKAALAHTQANADVWGGQLRIVVEGMLNEFPEGDYGVGGGERAIALLRQLKAERDAALVATKGSVGAFDALNAAHAGLELQLAAAREQYEVESHRWAVDMGEHREAIKVLAKRMLAEMARSGGA